MRVILLMLVSLVFSKLVYADDSPVAKFPIQGVIDGGTLIIPSYKTTHEHIPEKLFVYAEGKEYVATPRANKPFVARSTEKHPDCDDHNIGEYFYDLQPASKEERATTVIVFLEKKKFEFRNHKYLDLGTHNEWQNFELAGQESYHSIWRIKHNGKCIGHIDYYTQCHFDMEPDSDKAFANAKCGREIDGSGF